MYAVPSSTSPPSTPDRSRRSKYSSYSFASNPSTTPAGPPPSSYTNVSTTPAGPPPSSIFGNAETAPVIPFPSYSKSSATKPMKSSPLRFEDLREDDDQNGYDAMEEDEPQLDFGESVDDRSLVPRCDAVDVQATAKSLAGSPAPLSDNDWLVLETERIMSRLNAEGSSQTAGPYLDLDVAELVASWKGAMGPQSYATGAIGPATDASPTAKAIFLADLSLQLHHLPLSQKFSSSRSILRGTPPHVPISEFLLTWLITHHDPYPGEYDDVYNHKPNPTDHARFWDTICREVVRGNLKNAIDLLRIADFSYAITAIDDGASEQGYKGKQFENTNRVVRTVIKVLESCPGRSLDASRQGDWDVKGNDWAIFRKRVHQAFSDLESFAEGPSQDRLSDTNGFSQSIENVGVSSIHNGDLSLSQRSRKVESRVPWSIYQTLGCLYGQLLGTRAEIVAASANWMEAAILTTVWWDGEEDDAAHENLAASRRPGRRAQLDRFVDAEPDRAYLQKLALSLTQVLDDETSIEEADLQVNPTSIIEVGIACILSSETEGLIRILRSLSATIVTAFVEIARHGKWLQARPAPSKELMTPFDASNLMVLSYSQAPPSDDPLLRPDDLLIRYADLLSYHDKFTDTHTGGPRGREGWHLAIQVLGRVEDTDRASKHIGSLLDRLKFTNVAQVQETISLCSRLDLPTQARQISLRFADYNAARSPPKYGLALIYYARANNPAKMRDLLDILTITSLTLSTAHPPPNDTDIYLDSLLSGPKSLERSLSGVSTSSSLALKSHIAGYATVRRFFSLRNPCTDQTAMVQKRQAADPLFTLIQSSSDALHGGLYDPSLRTAVPVACLLVLLAETLPFFDPSAAVGAEDGTMPVLRQHHLFALLKAVEDLDAASERVWDANREVFESALDVFYSEQGKTEETARVLRKSVSNSLSESHFSMIASGSGLMSSEERTMNGTGTDESGSGVLVKEHSNSNESRGPSQNLSRSRSRNEGNRQNAEVDRAWDWRAGFAHDADGRDVLRILRVQIAREVARVWTLS
ncbi:MAG: hypothetical protein M1828_002332 [Chrysothrix sp. TS-e1954]|nr:MAG: hypothetical protein M1828_002332 [Chrysothrix sp. TS-e1954]